MASERLKSWTCGWEQVDFKTAVLHVRRAKNGTSSTHPLSGREMRELRRHQRESPGSPFVFVQSVMHPYRQAFPVWSSAQSPWQNWASRHMPTCCAMPVAISSPMTVTTRGRSRPISGTGIFKTRRAIPRWRRNGSRNFFGIAKGGAFPQAQWSVI
jgi:hypothetical protein